jgi:hypothetical protein
MLQCIRHSAVDCLNLRVGMQFELQYKTNIWIYNSREGYFLYVETCKNNAVQMWEWIIVTKYSVISDETGVRTLDVS